MKNFKKTLSVILCIIMMISSVPICFSANAIDNSNCLIDEEQTEESKAIQVAEIENKRDIYSKTYETSKGTNVVVFASVPLHYEENGELIEIDNTLTKSEDGAEILTNKSNIYEIELPEKLNENSEISLSYNNYSVSFKLIGGTFNSSSISISESDPIDVDEFNAESVAYATSNISNVTSTATYKNVFNNADIEYTISPETLKENIILNRCPNDDFSVCYELKAEGCSVKLNSDNSISIEANGNEIYTIDSPYMFDVDGNETDDILVTLETSNNGYIIRYTPNIEWLKSGSVSYPVTIDPTITVVNDTPNSVIEDTFVTTSTKTKNKSTMSTVTVQTASSDNWGYYNIKSLPELPDNSRITSCTLNLHTTSDVATPYNIALYALPDDATISNNFISTVTWNNKVLPTDTAIDMARTPQSAGLLSFDITVLANKWIQNNNLKRILVLKSFDGTSKASIAASEYLNNTSYVPYLSLEYTTIGGIDNSYSYHTQDIGLAGEAYINDYTGNLVVERTDFSSNGSANDITFYLGDGVNTPESNCFSNNVNLSYYQTLSFNPFNANEFILTSGDGHQKNISNNENIDIDNSNENEIIVTYNNGVDVFKDTYSRAVLSSNIGKTDSESTFALVCQAKQKNGMNQSDTEYSEIHIEYQADKIYSIYDEITSFEIEYTNGVISKLYAIPAFSDESVISDNSENYVGTNTVEYVFHSNATEIRLYDENDLELPGATVNYTYDNYGNIIEIIDDHGIKYSYEYNDNHQVTKVQEISSNDVEGNYLTFDYEDNCTIISDGTKTYREYFDNYGKLVSVIDQDGNAVFSQYKENLISKISKTRNSARNIADFYGFESNTDTSFTTNNGSVSISSEEKHTGNSSLKFVSSVGYTTLFSSKINNLKCNTTYTVSMWLKSSNASNCRLELTNGDNGAVSSNVAQDVNGWQRIFCTINTDNSYYIKVRLIVDNEDNATAIVAYVDDMCVQQSPYLTNMNLLTNGDFSNGLNSWNSSNTNNSVENVSGNIATVDNNRLSLQGTVNGTNTVSQIVSITAPAGTKYSFGGWIKAVDALPEKNGTDRELSISVYAVANDNTEVEISSINYTTGITDWQYIEDEIILPCDFGTSNDYAALKLVVSYNYQNGVAYVDGLSLSKEELYSIRYIYNSENEIVGIGLGEAIIPVNEDSNDSPNITAISNNEYDAYGNISKTETYTNVNFTTENATEIVKRCISNQFNYSNEGSLLTQEINTFGYCTDYKYDYYGNISYINDFNGCITEFEYDNFQNLSAIIKNFDWKDYTDDYSKFYENGLAPAPSPNPDPDSANIITQEELESNEYKSYSYISEEIYDKDNTLKIQYYYNGKQLVKIDTILYTLVVTKTNYEVVKEVVENDVTYETRQNRFTLTEEEFDSVNTYEFEYDEWGNLTAIYANDENHESPFVEYVYDSINYRQLNTVRYINGREINYVYDNNGNVIYKYDSDNNDGSTLSYSYYYYDNGDCYGKKNLITGEITSYQDGLTTVLDSEGKIIYSYGLDENKNKLQQVGNNFVKTVKTNNSQSTTVNGIISTITKTYDDFGRVISERMHVDGNDTDLLKVYYYYAHGNNFTEGIIDYNIENDYTQETSNYVRSIVYYVIDADTEYDYLLLNDVEEETHSEEITNDNNNSENEGVDVPNEEDTEVLIEEAFSEANLYWLNGKLATRTSYSVMGTVQYHYNSAGMICRSEPVVRGNDYRYDYSAGGNITDINYVEYTGSDIFSKRAVTKRNAHLSYDHNSGTSLNNCLTNIKWFNVNINSGVETLDEEINLSYDALGNMITYISDVRNMELNWCRGNVLNSVNIVDVDTDNSSSEYFVSYKYDDNNIRTEKVIDLGNNETITIKYIYEGNVLVGTTIKHITANTVDECDTIVLYDMDNNAYGFVLNKHVVQDGIEEIQSNLYYYIKGTDGAIYYVVGSDMSDENIEFVEYSYDDFGLPQMTCSDNSEMLAIYNPLIYKDYVYDWDTSMYYVNSRYYAPKTYRYISADLSFGRNNYTVLSTNLYAYCDNDPINQKVK